LETNARGNLLYELAQTMATTDGHSAAVALRKLAQAGYTSLDQADKASDWVLLSIPGMGVGRLEALRRLTRANWRQPTAQAVKVVSRFLLAARSALRYWPAETLETLARGAALNGVQGHSFDSRLAIELFATAASRALAHCQAEELVEILRHMQSGHRACAYSNPGSICPIGTQPDDLEGGNAPPPGSVASETAPGNGSPARETGHFAYPRTERPGIVLRYRAACGRGAIKNKDQWAQSNYGISGRTLLRYEREFPVAEEALR